MLTRNAAIHSDRRIMLIFNIVNFEIYLAVGGSNLSPALYHFFIDFFVVLRFVPPRHLLPSHLYIRRCGQQSSSSNNTLATFQLHTYAHDHTFNNNYSNKRIASVILIRTTGPH